MKLWAAAGWGQTSVHQRDPHWRRHSGRSPPAAPGLRSGPQGHSGGRVWRCRYEILLRVRLYPFHLFFFSSKSAPRRLFPESVVPSSGTFHVKLPKRREVELGITISGGLRAAEGSDAPLTGTRWFSKRTNALWSIKLKGHTAHYLLNKRSHWASGTK